MGEEKKWKVLIADDEEMIQRLIQALIPWEELHLELAAMASNGLEAIAYLKEHPADILITDARMPECDGIQLIKWCNEQNRDMKYIVISGYRHFEYAHGALKYGADSYLLKPINQEELTANLKAIVQKLEGDRDTDTSRQELQQQMDLNRDRMRRHFISSYVFDGKDFPDRDIASLDYINEEFQMNFSDGIYRAVFIKVDDTKHSGMNLGRVLALIQEEAEACWKDYLTENIGTPVHSGVMFFVNCPETEENRLKADLEILYEKLVRMLDIFEGVRVTIGLSHRESSINEIRRCMVTAADAIKYRLYLPHVSIIDYDNYSYKKVHYSAVWTQERSRLLENYMRTGNEKGIQKLIFDLKLEIHQDKEISPVSIYEIAKAVAENAVAVFSSALEGNTGKYNLMDTFLQELDNRKTVDSIAACLEKLILQCIEIMNTEMKQQEIQPIRIIREYIEAHFAENISLNDVADQVQLSKNYVSAIFRKETGVNFLDFLTSRRIDEAAKLLRRTNMSISEIAEKVGYTDVKYFSKMCKKNLGMNPSEYRKLYS